MFQNKLWVKVLLSKYKVEDLFAPDKLRVSNSSWLWRNMVRVWPILLQGIGWDIGNESSIKFWLYSWHSDLGPLLQYATSEIPDDLIWRPLCYFIASDGSWRWDLMSHYLPSVILEKLANKNVHLFLDIDDEIYWKFTANGNFSVKSAYLALTNYDANDNEQIWRLVWKWRGPQRVRTFLWLTAHSRLLTNEERFRRHIAAESRCSFCDFQYESILHVLRDCCFAKSIWTPLLHGLPLPDFFSIADVVHWVEKNLSLNYTTNGVEWQSLFAITC